MRDLRCAVRVCAPKDLAACLTLGTPPLEMATSKRPPSMIALDAGYSDQLHFARVFWQALGETPGQYARSLQRCEYLLLVR